MSSSSTTVPLSPNDIYDVETNASVDDILEPKTPPTTLRGRSPVGFCFDDRSPPPILRRKDSLTLNLDSRWTDPNSPEVPDISSPLDRHTDIYQDQVSPWDDQSEPIDCVGPMDISELDTYTPPQMPIGNLVRYSSIVASPDGRFVQFPSPPLEQQRLQWQSGTGYKLNTDVPVATMDTSHILPVPPLPVLQRQVSGYKLNTDVPVATMDTSHILPVPPLPVLQRQVSGYKPSTDVPVATTETFHVPPLPVLQRQVSGYKPSTDVPVATMDTSYVSQVPPLSVLQRQVGCLYRTDSLFTGW